MLVLWEHSYQESHYTYHIHENLPGLLMMILRIALSGLFAYNLKFTIANEKSTLRQQFYHSFSFVRHFTNVGVLVILRTVLHAGLLSVVSGISCTDGDSNGVPSILETQGNACNICK